MTSLPSSALFPGSLAEATGVQKDLAAKVVTRDDLPAVRLVGGADISHNPRDPSHIVHAAFVTLDAADARLVTAASATGVARFPYVPGFLGFREVPALVEAWEKLAAKPDLVFVDGHGISHPRGLGIASHLGVVLDIPTIGVAKSILVGTVETPVADEPGSRSPLIWKGRTIGMAVRTRKRASPVYVSTGHRISLETAVAWVLRMGRGYRLPEPTRQAHLASNAARRAAQTAE
ncbi:MAG: deoxyribonuclease V [Pseudomonadota bacterium]|nr:deoxyribonuclease V [Pseudomonadota bacterium]